MKKGIYVLIAAFMAASMTMGGTLSYADVLTDAKTTKDEAETKLSELNIRAEELKKKQEGIQEEINEMDASLIQIMSDIDILEEEVTEKKKEIEEIQKDFDAAKKDEQEQLDAMKLRIKYMYENNSDTVSTSIIEGNDTSSSLNKETLFNDMYSYDREQLDKYEKAKQKVQDIMDVLQDEKNLLDEKENSLKEEKEQLEAAIEEKQKNSQDYNREIRDTRKLAKKYSDTVKAQNEIISRQLALLYPSSKTGAYDKTYVAPGSGTGTDIANYALQFLGNPYVYGGTSMTNGIDCSAFTQQVYAHFGYSLPRTSSDQRYSGRAISIDELQPGDLVCYSGHVAIYIGNGKIVHASNRKTGIKISNNVGYRSVVAFRRIVN